MRDTDRTGTAASGDLAEFVARVATSARPPSAPLHGFFRAVKPVAIARAPGRLDVMGGIADYSGSLVLQRTYAVRQPTAHPIREYARVCRFAELLGGDPDEADLRAMGALMSGSHASYSACGLGSGGTDRLVALVREAGPASGLYGAKITGGGSGGTVAVLGRADAEAAVAETARRYAEETRHPAFVFSGSSPGPTTSGCRCWKSRRRPVGNGMGSHSTRFDR